MNINEIRILIADDLAALDRKIRARLMSDVALIDQVSHYIISAGGKRLRPIVLLIAARACGYEGDDHIESAAIIEFIHTATLLHDDVVDASGMRRGQESAHRVWGNQASVLVGDFLYSRAFQMMVAIDKMDIMDILADATNTIAEGEVLQLLNAHNPDTTEERYLRVIERKTAKLFEAGARIAAILTKQPREIEVSLAAYGMQLGTAFQLVDDTMDYESNAEELGKNIGDDLAEGLPTLPLIRAMRTGTSDQVELIREAIRTGTRERIGEITAVVESTGSIQYTAELAQTAVRKAHEALEALPQSRYRDALHVLADFAIKRTS